MLAAHIAGNTDSELAFTLFLSLLKEEIDGEYGADDLALAMRRTVETIAGWWREDGDERLLALNFCVTDGSSIVATRLARTAEPPSLHYCRGSRYVCESGVCHVLAEEGDGCVLVASEVLSESAEWVEVGPDRLVVVRDARSVSEESLSV